VVWHGLDGSQQRVELPLQDVPGEEGADLIAALQGVSQELGHFYRWHLEQIHAVESKHQRLEGLVAEYAAAEEGSSSRHLATHQLQPAIRELVSQIALIPAAAQSSTEPRAASARQASEDRSSRGLASASLSVSPVYSSPDPAVEDILPSFPKGHAFIRQAPYPSLYGNIS